AETSELAKVLWEEAARSDDELKVVHKAFVQTAFDQVEPLVDVHTLCTTLQNTSTSERVKDAATRVLERLHDERFLMAHDGTGPDAHRLHGLGVYMPHIFTNGEWADLNIKADTYEVLW